MTENQDSGSVLLTHPLHELEPETAQPVSGSHDNCRYVSRLDASQKAQQSGTLEVEPRGNIVVLDDLTASKPLREMVSQELLLPFEVIPLLGAANTAVQDDALGAGVPSLLESFLGKDALVSLGADRLDAAFVRPFPNGTDCDPIALCNIGYAQHDIPLSYRVIAALCLNSFQ